MTVSDWSRAVDEYITTAAPGLRFALDGRTAFAVARGEEIPESVFQEPTWRNQGRRVRVYSLGDDRQLRAMFIPPVTEDVPVGESAEQLRAREARAAHHECFYDRSEDGARKAAAAIVRYLNFTDLP